MKYIILLIIVSIYYATTFSIVKIIDRYRHNALYNSNREILIKDDFIRRIELARRPAHIGIPRKNIDLRFAIQLMRSSYNTVDDIDIVAMDEFQKDFFLFRQLEWNDYYTYYNSNNIYILQGDLSNALYFDFISFCQYATLSNKIKNAQLQFVEKIGAQGETQLVRRNPLIEEDELLPLLHSQIVGDKLLDFILEKYPLVTPKELARNYNKTEGSRSQLCDPSRFVEYSQQILDVFSFNTYAVQCNIVNLPSTKENNIYQITSKAPVNLWSLQVLRFRNDMPTNDFEVKVADAIARRCGCMLQVLSTKVQGSIDVIYTVKLLPLSGVSANLVDIASKIITMPSTYLS